MAKAMKINRRVVDTKRHTVGFILSGGKEVSRKQAVQMASRGQITGVRVVKGSDGPYIQSTGRRNLYALPITKSAPVSPRKSRRAASKR